MIQLCGMISLSCTVCYMYSGTPLGHLNCRQIFGSWKFPDKFHTSIMDTSLLHITDSKIDSKAFPRRIKMFNSLPHSLPVFAWIIMEYCFIDVHQCELVVQLLFTLISGMCRESLPVWAYTCNFDQPLVDIPSMKANGSRLNWTCPAPVPVCSANLSEFFGSCSSSLLFQIFIRHDSPLCFYTQSWKSVKEETLENVCFGSNLKSVISHAHVD